LETGDTNEILSLLYPLDEQLRSEPYRGGSKVVTPDALVYAEPSEALPPMATVNAGVLVEVLDRKTGWVNVKIPAGLPVWIMANLVRMENDQVVVDRLEAPLFSAPESAAEAIGLGTVTKGEKLQLIENKGAWLMVRSPERFTGWMKRTDIASKIVLADEGGSETLTSEKHTQGAVTVDADPAGLAEMISDAELFQSPERQSTLLGVVANGTEISIVERNEGFVFAEKVQVSGWVSRRLVRLRQRTDAEGEDSTAFTAVVNTDVARVRSRPDIQSIDFGRLTRNEEAPVIEQSGQWVRVGLGVGSGWIVSQLVEQEKGGLPEDGITAADESEVAEDLDEAQSAEPDQTQLPLPESIGEEEQLLADLSGAADITLEEPTEQDDLAVAIERSETSATAAQKEPNVEQESVSASAARNKSLAVKADSVLYLQDSTASTPLGRVLDSVPVSANDKTAMYRFSTPVPVYGWVYASLARENGQQAEILRGGVRIRLDPDTDRDNIIGVRNRGDLLPLLERRNGWLKVAIDPVAGWVLGSDID